MTTRRIEEIDILRGFAAVCMILGHSFLRYPIDLTGVTWCSVVEHWIFTFHMELFFFLAGVCYHASQYGEYIKKKAMRIIVPYIAFSIITIIFKAFGGSAVNRDESVGTGFVKMLLYGGNYWFLYVLFEVFLIYPLVEKVINTRIKKIVLISVLLLLDLFIDIPAIFKVRNLVYYLPFFISGHLTSELMAEKQEKIKDIMSKCTLRFFLICFCIAFYVVLDQIEIHDIWTSDILSYFRAMGFIFFLGIVSQSVLSYVHGEWFSWIRGILCDCSKYSLQLYLFNGFILTGMRIIICNLLGIKEPLLIVFPIWIANIVITVISCKYIIPKIRVIRMFCGL